MNAWNHASYWLGIERGSKFLNDSLSWVVWENRTPPLQWHPLVDHGRSRNYPLRVIWNEGNKCEATTCRCWWGWWVGKSVCTVWWTRFNWRVRESCEQNTDMADPIGQVQPWMSHKTNGIDLGQGLACKELHEYIDFYS